ncbi:MAG: hypothetical protein V2I36_14690 [Desulfopila sp.]|jgi:hypothetical protein|nr:hypothetical protein [Desulfopila sp.]
MKWNVSNIVFLHQPEHFMGRFDNAKMQEKHELSLQKSLDAVKAALTAESDPLKALWLLHKKDHMQFLLNNLEEFQRNDRFEEAVIALYSVDNAPFSSGGDSALWAKLFNQCERSRLGRCGSPFPAGIDKVYRGSVSGFKQSLAWTPDRKIVEKFAQRWSDPALGGGELYEVAVSPENVLVFIQKSYEGVAILSPEYVSRADIRPYRGASRDFS